MSPTGQTEMDSPRSTAHLVFRLRQDVAIEEFEDRALVLLCDSLQLREINVASRRILVLLDGRRTVEEVAEQVAREAGESPDATRAPVLEALLEMETQGLVTRVVKLRLERGLNMNESQYLVNPDVSFRQEDEDGGILFNPDTDALEVLNPTAAAIWLYVAAPRTRAEIADHLCEVFEGASREQVEKDVEEFLETLLKKGFVGTLEKSE